MLAHLIAALAGYLIGSIPFAYLVTKQKTGLDLRAHGTRNIGATNAFDVTGKKSIGRLVLVLDVLKGLLPVLALELFGSPVALVYIMPALVFGHCYPLWLRFHGGRGLATSVGVLLLVSPGVLIVWGVGYVVTHKLRPHVHVAAVAATLLIAVVLLLAPSEMISATTLSFSGLQSMPGELRLSILAVAAIILSRHVGPLIRLAKGQSSY